MSRDSSIRRSTDGAITRLRPRKSCLSQIQFLCSISDPFLRPDLNAGWRRAQPRSRLAEGHRRRRARSGLDGGEHDARLAQVGARLPKNPADRARVRALAEIVACDIHPINNLRVLRYLIHQLGHDKAAIANWYNHWIAAGFEALEPLLLASDTRTGDFCHGDSPGLADIALVPQVVNAERYRIDLTPYPTLVRTFENCMKLEPFIAAHPNNQPDYEA
jgi:hypothetical protein